MVPPPLPNPGRRASVVALGIIAAVYGSLGVLVNTAVLLTEVLRSRENAEFNPPAIADTPFYVAGLLLALFLLFASIGLLRAKPSSVAMMRWWAMLYLVSIVLLAAKAFTFDLGVMERNISNQHIEHPERSREALAAFYWVASVGSYLFFAILPITTLVLLRKRNAQALASLA